MSKKEKIFNYTLVSITAVIMIASAIVTKQTFFKTLPVLISLVVVLLSARANRYAFLLGSINSVLYGLVYISEGVYFSAINALLISFPMQMISFFSWKRRSYGKVNTQFRRLSAKNLIWTMLAHVPVWIVVYFGLSAFVSGNYPVLDSLIFVMSITVLTLNALRYIEAQYINAVVCCINVIMWILITLQSPNDIIYVCIASYNFIMVIESAFVWTKKYKQQQAELLAKNQQAS